MALQLKAERGTAGDCRGTGQNGAAVEVIRRMGYILRSRLAAVGAGLLAVEFSEQGTHRRLLGKVIAMRTVVAEEIVPRSKRLADGGRHRLLSDAEMYRAAHLIGRMVFSSEGLLAATQA